MTKARQEQIARINLERQNYNVYLPLTRDRAKFRLSEVAPVTPLFPRYLFVDMDPDHSSVGPIRSTVGGCGLVRFGTALAPVPSGLVEALQTGEAQRWNPVVDPLVPGQPVRVVEGPFAGMNGLFSALAGRERVVVLMEWLGGTRRLELPARAMESATAA